MKNLIAALLVSVMSLTAFAGDRVVQVGQAKPDAGVVAAPTHESVDDLKERLVVFVQKLGQSNGTKIEVVQLLVSAENNPGLMALVTFKSTSSTEANTFGLLFIVDKSGKWTIFPETFL